MSMEALIIGMTVGPFTPFTCKGDILFPFTTPALIFFFFYLACPL